MQNEMNQNIHQLCEDLSSPLDYSQKDIAIVLAAGHGKRIKSHKSKMLHNIWGVPSVERVFNACAAGIPGINSIVVVGIKAPDVMKVIGEHEKTQFVYQEIQKGTGHAVQVGMDKIDSKKFSGTVYVLPGDMGLLNKETMTEFGERFNKSKSDMMVLTGIYEGPTDANYYGRIVRVKDKDSEGISSGEDSGKVIEIIEHKDILAIPESDSYTTFYKGRKYNYSREELLAITEYNSGVYAFDYKKLTGLIHTIKSDNSQNEIYITDLIGLFNQQGYTVSAISPKEQYVLMGFNDKTVLKEMEKVYRKNVYNSIKNIIEIEDPDDFFMHDSVVENILNQDTKGEPLDIHLGKGVYIGKGVDLNYNLTLKRNVVVTGNVFFGRNVTVWENVLLSTFPNQKFVIGNNVEILWGDIVKGNIIIGDNSKIESSVNLTGSDDYPLHIGKNVLVKGTSYIFGSIIEDDIHIEHSVLIKKRIEKLIKKNGQIQKVQFYLPMPSGIDAITDL
ncbi:MAG: NTP transferase domain-containing protein [Ignavibacteriaceae bacterium]